MFGRRAEVDFANGCLCVRLGPDVAPVGEDKVPEGRAGAPRKKSSDHRHDVRARSRGAQHVPVGPEQQEPRENHPERGPREHPGTPVEAREHCDARCEILAFARADDGGREENRCKARDAACDQGDERVLDDVDERRRLGGEPFACVHELPAVVVDDGKGGAGAHFGKTCTRGLDGGLQQSVGPAVPIDGHGAQKGLFVVIL